MGTIISTCVLFELLIYPLEGAIMIKTYIQKSLVAALLTLGLTTNALAEIASQNYVITYEQSASVSPSTTMNAYHTQTVSAADKQAIASTCKDNNKTVYLSSKAAPDGRQMLYCDSGANKGTALNKATSELVTTSNKTSKCRGGAC